jgi:hypothetical protein
VNAEENIWTYERKGIENYTPVFIRVNRSKTVRWTEYDANDRDILVYTNVWSEELNDREFFIYEYMGK